MRVKGIKLCARARVFHPSKIKDNIKKTGHSKRPDAPEHKFLGMAMKLDALWEKRVQIIF
jgi:hypothetical protein